MESPKLKTNEENIKSRNIIQNKENKDIIKRKRSRKRRSNKSNNENDNYKNHQNQTKDNKSDLNNNIEATTTNNKSKKYRRKMNMEMPSKVNNQNETKDDEKCNQCNNNKINRRRINKSNKNKSDINKVQEKIIKASKYTNEKKKNIAIMKSKLVSHSKKKNESSEETNNNVKTVIKWTIKDETNSKTKEVIYETVTNSIKNKALAKHIKCKQDNNITKNQTEISDHESAPKGKTDNNTFNSTLNKIQRPSQKRIEKSLQNRKTAKNKKNNIIIKNSKADGNNIINVKKSKKQKNTQNKPTLFFRNYIDKTKIEKLLEQHKALKGTIRLNPQYPYDAYADTNVTVKDIHIAGIKNRNRACNGDIVIIQLLPIRKWFTGKQWKEEHNLDGIPLKNVQFTPENINKIVSTFSVRPKGKVIYVFHEESTFKKQKRVVILCNQNLKITVSSSTNYLTFNAIDNYYPSSFLVSQTEIPKNIKLYTNNHMYILEYSSWDPSEEFPYGRFLDYLGTFGDRVSETKAILLQSGIDYNELSEEVMNSIDCLNIPNIVIEKEISNRLDLRDKRIFSIDPPNAKDLDDALHCMKISDNEYEIGIHIADVSHYVQENSMLDIAAFRRSTSVYLVDHVLPMLPAILCEDLLSLNPGVDRLTVSVIWNIKIDINTNEITHSIPEIKKSIINSCAKLDYITAQKIIEGEIIPEKNIGMNIWHKNRRPRRQDKAQDEKYSEMLSNIAQDVKTMHIISTLYREERYNNGALSIDRTKLYFSLDEHANPVHVGKYQRYESHYLVEEFMLKANYYVAEYLIKHVPSHDILLRCHPTASNEALERFQENIKKHGKINYFDINTAGSIALSLNRMRNENTDSFVDMYKSLLIACMRPAEYFAAKYKNKGLWIHYALCIPYYSHFTSPIRRYADIVVHRLLSDIISKPSDNKSKKSSENRNFKLIADHCNKMRINAKRAEENFIFYFLCMYIRENPIVTTAIITEIKKSSFNIFVPLYGEQSKLYLKDIFVTGDYNEKLPYLIIKPMTKLKIDKILKDNLLNDVAIEYVKGRKWNEIKLTMFTEIKVYLSVFKNKFPLDIHYTFVGI